MGKARKPRFPADGKLRPADRTDLRLHLAKFLDAREAKDVEEEIERWLDNASHMPEWLGLIADLTNDMRRRAAAVAKKTRELEALLAAAPEVEWRLDAASARLERLRLCADAVASGPTQPGGRPRLEWREDLVVCVHSSYPRRRGWRAHFDETIGLVLRFLNVELEDLPGEVGRILVRTAPAPASGA